MLSFREPACFPFLCCVVSHHGTPVSFPPGDLWPFLYFSPLLVTDSVFWNILAVSPGTHRSFCRVMPPGGIARSLGVRRCHVSRQYHTDFPSGRAGLYSHQRRRREGPAPQPPDIWCWEICEWFCLAGMCEVTPFDEQKLLM